MRELSDIRKDIDKIDSEMLDLFKRRMDCAREVALYKKENNIPIFNARRENEILAEVQTNGGEYGEAAKELFSKLMELSRELQKAIATEPQSVSPFDNRALI